MAGQTTADILHLFLEGHKLKPESGKQMLPFLMQWDRMGEGPHRQEPPSNLVDMEGPPHQAADERLCASAKDVFFGVYRKKKKRWTYCQLEPKRSVLPT